MDMRKGFTLAEILVVIIILGVIAAFAVPNYGKSIDRAHEKDATVNLMAIYAAQKVYYNLNNATYATGADVTTINTNLDLGVLANGMTYACPVPAAGTTTFYCTATYASFKLGVNPNTSNPCCCSAACPTIATACAPVCP